MATSTSSDVNFVRKLVQKKLNGSEPSGATNDATSARRPIRNIPPQPKDASTGRSGFVLYGTTRHSKTCPNCAESGRIVYDATSGDELCRQCGIVLESKVLSEEQEWRNFSQDASSGKGTDRNRVGEAIDHWLEDGVAATTMVGASRRFQQLNEATASLSGNDKSLKSAFHHIRLIAEAFSLRENVVEISKEIAKELQEMGQLKNKNSVLSMLAVIYLACREASVTRTIKELVIYDRSLTEKELGKAINRIKKLLPQRGPAFSETASQLLPRFCSRLNLSINIMDTAEHVTKRSTSFITTSHRPNTLAAGAIYFVVQLCDSPDGHLPKASKIAEITGAGEHTMKFVCKELLDVAEYVLPQDFKPSNEAGLEGLKAKLGSKGTKRKLT